VEDGEPPASRARSIRAPASDSRSTTFTTSCTWDALMPSTCSRSSLRTLNTASLRTSSARLVLSVKPTCTSLDLSGLQDSEADRERWCLERHRPGELAGRRAANRGRAPAATLATSLLACRQPTRPSAETTLHGCGRHTRRRCPPARLSSAHAQPAQPLAPRLPSPRDATASPVQGSGPCTRTRTGRCRGDPARSHAGPRQGRSASLRRVTAGPAGRKHPATAASW
jgi:hypothetical protein